MKSAWIPTLLLSAASLLTLGCASHAAYVAYYGPPAPHVERYGYAPGPGYVWIPGYYSWAGGSYNWVGGRWTLPPRPHAAWVQGHYVKRYGHSEYIEGHWR
jgi:hypothetical protein